MKSSQIAAAVLAALTVSTAQADSLEIVDTGIISSTVIKTMCIPIWKYEGKVEIATLCDASDLNKKYNLKVDDNGCVVGGEQTFEENNGYVYEQASSMVWGQNQEEVNKQLLPKCTEYDAASYAVEL